MGVKGHEGGAPIVKLRGVRKSYGEGSARVDVLRGIDLEIFRGEVAAVLGASGSGKSTLLNVVGGLDPADDGSVEVCGERLDGAGERELERSRAVLRRSTRRLSAMIATSATALMRVRAHST